MRGPGRYAWSWWETLIVAGIAIVAALLIEWLGGKLGYE